MARGEMEISHAAFAALPSNRMVNYVRDLLVAVDALPAYHAELERTTRWLRDYLPTLPKAHTEILGRYARWHVLRRLRHQEAAGTITHGAINGARGSIIASAGLLAWLDDHDCEVGTVTQSTLELYAVERPGQAKAVVQFLAWGRRHGLSSDAELPSRQYGRAPKQYDRYVRRSRLFYRRL